MFKSVCGSWTDPVVNHTQGARSEACLGLSCWVPGLSDVLCMTCMSNQCLTCNHKTRSPRESVTCPTTLRQSHVRPCPIIHAFVPSCLIMSHTSEVPPCPIVSDACFCPKMFEKSPCGHVGTCLISKICLMMSDSAPHRTCYGSDRCP